MKKLRLLIVDSVVRSSENTEGASFLSNESRYIKWHNYPPVSFPRSFQPVKLVALIMSKSMQKELWNGYKHLPCLRVLELNDMGELRSTPDFDGVPCLKNLILYNCMELEEIHPSLGNNTCLEYLKVSCCGKLKRIPTISRMKNIKTLIITACNLKDGEIPWGIGELSSLLELDLTGNSYSRLDFSLLQLTRLKYLNLSYCSNLLELPKLPTSLAILKAYHCKSLIIVEDFNKDCKQLCQVLLDKYEWSDMLLQSMLKGKALENECMHLRLTSLEIPKGFTPLLIRQRSCRMELPENWCSDFSGFLICAVVTNVYFHPCRTSISMKQVSDVDFKDDVVWEETSDRDKKYLMTWVWYVSFGSLRHTTWWDQTYKYLEFQVKDSGSCYGFGVKLVDKENANSLTETSSNSYSPYTPKFKITHDSSSELKGDLVQYWQGRI